MLARGYKVDSRGRFIHRVVCRQAHGPFPYGWVVHHIDCKVDNNEPSNLIALPRNLHNSIHKVMKRDSRIMPRKEIEQAVRAWRNLRVSKSANVTIVVVADESKNDLSKN